MRELLDLRVVKELIVQSQTDFNKRKATLSIKLLEELQKKEAWEKYGSEGSGKIPHSPLFLRI